jgi:hypothetical protein
MKNVTPLPKERTKTDSTKRQNRSKNLIVISASISQQLTVKVA